MGRLRMALSPRFQQQVLRVLVGLHRAPAQQQDRAWTPQSDPRPRPTSLLHWRTAVAVALANQAALANRATAAWFLRVPIIPRRRRRIRPTTSGLRFRRRHLKRRRDQRSSPNHHLGRTLFPTSRTRSCRSLLLPQTRSRRFLPPRTRSQRSPPPQATQRLSRPNPRGKAASESGS